MGNKDTEMRQERDHELYLTYLRGLREQHFDYTYEAADWARNQPAPRFYVSSKALVNYIGAIAHGSQLPTMFSQNRKKMKLLYEMYLEFQALNPGNKLSRERICEMLVDEPAPMFYIGHESAMKIILRERQRHLASLSRKEVG